MKIIKEEKDDFFINTKSIKVLKENSKFKKLEDCIENLNVDLINEDGYSLNMNELNEISKAIIKGIFSLFNKSKSRDDMSDITIYSIVNNLIKLLKSNETRYN